MPETTTTRSAERTRFLADVIVTALEGGIGYWATALRYKWSDEAPETTCAIVMEDDNEDHSELVDRAVAGWVSTGKGEPTALDLFELGLKDNAGDLVIHKIDLDAIEKGIGIIAANENFCATTIRRPILHGNIDNDAGDIDAWGADAIVQAAVFGKLVFG